MKVQFILLLLFCLPGLSFEANAQQIQPKTICTNLKNPSGIAIRPLTGEVFVSDTGRGRVIEVSKDGNKDVIVNFPISEFEFDREFIAGPTSLMFRDRNLIMVSTNGSTNGGDSISFFDLENIGLEPFDARRDVVQQIQMQDKQQPAEINYYSMVRNKTTAYFVAYGGGFDGWINKVDLVASEVVDQQKFINTHQLSDTKNPSGIALSPEGYLVTAQVGTKNQVGDSSICFYDQQGRLLDEFPTGLSDIVALAYGPKKKRLFALDFSWEEPSKGGLYKLVAVDSQAGCEAVLIAQIDRPTSMAFDRSGNLWVTHCGLADKKRRLESEFSSPGQVLMFPNVDK